MTLGVAFCQSQNKNTVHTGPANIRNIILKKKFDYSKGFIMSPCLQNDAVSCGVLSCFYTSQINKGTCSFPFKSATNCFWFKFS